MGYTIVGAYPVEDVNKDIRQAYMAVAVSALLIIGLLIAATFV